MFGCFVCLCDCMWCMYLCVCEFVSLWMCLSAFAIEGVWLRVCGFVCLLVVASFVCLRVDGFVCVF